MKLTISVSEGRFGTPQPQILVTFEKNISHRAKDAIFYALAAEVSIATEFHERWIVTPDSERSCVYLELSTGSAGEVECARRMLTDVARIPDKRQLLTAISERVDDPIVTVTVAA